MYQCLPNLLQTIGTSSKQSRRRGWGWKSSLWISMNGRNKRTIRVRKSPKISFLFSGEPLWICRKHYLWWLAAEVLNIDLQYLWETFILVLVIYCFLPGLYTWSFCSCSMNKNFQVGLKFQHFHLFWEGEELSLFFKIKVIQNQCDVYCKAVELDTRWILSNLSSAYKLWIGVLDISNI